MPGKEHESSYFGKYYVVVEEVSQNDELFEKIFDDVVLYREVNNIITGVRAPPERVLDFGQKYVPLIDSKEFKLFLHATPFSKASTLKLKPANGHPFEGSIPFARIITNAELVKRFSSFSDKLELNKHKLKKLKDLLESQFSKDGGTSR